jgi:hypothetical protein
LKKISTKLILAGMMIIFLSSSLFSQQLNSRKYFLKSALIPGWGELSMQKKSGYVFMAAEFLMWGTAFYFDEEAKLKKTASINYAIQYAHIDPDGDYNNDFYYHLSKYKSYGYNSGGYNAHIVEEAMSKFPDDPTAQSTYIQNNSYNEDFYWEWDDKVSKHDYAIMRKRITEYKSYIKGITGGILANHLVSAINSLLLANKVNRMELGMEFNKNLNPTLTLSYKF